MTDRVECMRNNSKNASTVWLEYIQSKKKQPCAYYFFFEGYDRVYYLNKFKESYSKIKNNKPEIQHFECGGKTEVNKLYGKLEKANEKLEKMMFIVDKDYEDRRQINAHFFQTEYYSLENYYTAKEVVAEIIEEEFAINSGSEAYEEITNNYSALHKEFIEKLTDYNILVLTCKKNKIDLDLDILSISACFQMKSDFTIKFINSGIDGKELHELNIEYLLERYSKNIEKLKKDNEGRKVEELTHKLSILNENIPTIKRSFNENKLKYSSQIECYFRGKEDFKFLILFLKFVQKVYGRGAINFNSSKSDYEMLSSLSKHAILTQDLEKFFRSKISA